MRKIIFTLFLLLCSNPVWAASLDIVTTTEDLKSVVEYIGGDLVHVESLGKGTQDYHFLAAKPSYMIQAKKADLFIINGLELEIGYVPLVLEGARNSRIKKGQSGYLDASEGILPLEIPDHVDRSMGDIHPGGNPHYILDPLNMKIVASHIAKRLSELSPDNAAVFQSNLKIFNDRIDQKMQEWQKVLSAYKGEKLITYHKIWPYFARRFGFEVVFELEPKPGIPPTPSHLKEIIDLVKRDNIKVILNENIHKRDAADFVAQATAVHVVAAPVSVGGTKEAKDYFALIDSIVSKLVEGFGS